MTILVTGGAGYIGSHTVIMLLENNFPVVILDNLSNSSVAVIDRISEITGKKIEFINGDVNDSEVLKKIFSSHVISAVIHFAGLKSVGESAREPLKYYHNNVVGTLTLLHEMQCAKVKKLIFSSSATVYGNPEMVPLKESSSTGNTTNPYGTSKYFSEKILKDCAIADNSMQITILRYFNPAGAHQSGMIGESPNGIPNNLIPYLLKVANGALEYLSIFGNDYPTKDGTGVRDYIHVMDLASGHLAALRSLLGPRFKNYYVYNLGTGCSYSVLDVISAFEQETGIVINYKYLPRRVGDVAECWSDPTLAEKELQWKASLSLNDMMRDGWRWQVNNPSGYC